MCTYLSGYDCDNDNQVDYDSCESRDSEYDYDNDCIRDSADSQATDADLCGTHDCNPHNAHDCSECCDDPHDCHCTGSPPVCDTCYTCYDYDSCPNTCSGTYVISGYDCPGSNCADSNCRYIEGYDCNGDDAIDNDVDLCPYVSAGYDCFGDDLADPDCVYIDGYDCGENGGALYNQNPDGVIDDNDNYCAHIMEGYDCDSNCNALHPNWAGGSNNGIDGGECGAQTQNIFLKVSIMNGEGRTPPDLNEYFCTLNDNDYEIDAFIYDDEDRFLPEGCREAFNAVYFDDGGMYQYIRYEDWIEQAAKATCQWRDPMTILSCMDEPYRDVNTAYIHVENLSNPEMAVE